MVAHILSGGVGIHQTSVFVWFAKHLPGQHLVSVCVWRESSRRVCINKKKRRGEMERGTHNTSLIGQPQKISFLERKAATGVPYFPFPSANLIVRNAFINIVQWAKWNGLLVGEKLLERKKNHSAAFFSLSLITL